jgi:dTDP-4-dehydrorhamnose reductase
VSNAVPERALITGAGGQVGLALCQCPPSGWELAACETGELDVTRPDQVRAVLQRRKPTLVIHAAAYTGVDAAEGEPDRAEAVNVAGTRHLAEAARDVGARLLYLSTDFVFDGTAGRPYAPDDPARPLGVYGRTKLAGEREAQRLLGDRAVVVRTAWVYSRYRQNFVLTMLRLMRERDEVGIVSDQVGTPTWAASLADAIWRIASLPNLSGTMHWTDAGVASWYDFGVAIQEEALAAGLLTRAVPIRPLRSEEFPAPARRPPYSVLDKSGAWTTLGRTPSHWRVNLRCMLRELARG